MTNEVAVKNDGGAIMESVLVKGDLAKLTPQERTTYYMKVCESVNINPLTQPFAYITLNGKMTLYALRAATDQLRAIHKVSVTDMTETEREGVFIVTTKVSNGEGRTDIAKGAVNIAGLKGEALANALMKAETKSKRRATLSICGLGMLDETEVETIPNVDVTPYETDVAKPKSPFKTAALRNQFQNNCMESLEKCKTAAELNAVITMDKDQFDLMRVSGDERDQISVDEVQKRYKLRLMQMKTPQDEPVEEGGMTEEEIQRYGLSDDSLNAKIANA